jgi:hypothetical protein
MGSAGVVVAGGRYGEKRTVGNDCLPEVLGILRVTRANP